MLFVYKFDAQVSTCFLLFARNIIKSKISSLAAGHPRPSTQSGQPATNIGYIVGRVERVTHCASIFIAHKHGLEGRVQSDRLSTRADQQSRTAAADPMQYGRECAVGPVEGKQEMCNN